MIFLLIGIHTHIVLMKIIIFEAMSVTKYSTHHWYSNIGLSRCYQKLAFDFWWKKRHWSFLLSLFLLVNKGLIFLDFSFGILGHTIFQAHQQLQTNPNRGITGTIKIVAPARKMLNHILNSRPMVKLEQLRSVDLIVWVTGAYYITQLYNSFNNAMRDNINGP